MKEHLIQEVQRQMLPYLNNAQLKQLKAVLEKALTGVTVHRDKAADVSESVDTVSLFITAKRIEGCSEKTLNYYRQDHLCNAVRHWKIGAGNHHRRLAQVSHGLPNAKKIQQGHD